MEIVLFYIFAALTVAGAIGVMLSKDIVRAAVQLLLALLGVAGNYFLLNAEFLAAVQLVIYVGGTLVLIIFGVMLTARAATLQLQPSTSERVAAIFSGLVLLVSLIASVISSGLVSHTPAAQKYSMQALGAWLLSDFLAPFELTSLLLLAVMLGAAYLARRRPSEESR